MKHEGLKGIIESGKAPGLSGLETGSGRWNSEPHFNRFHAPTDIPRLAARMESDGVFERKPEMRKLVEIKVDAVKGKEDIIQKVDYDKTGHPLERRKGNRTEI